MNAIITGATRGIGKAIALKLAEHGYNLAVCSRNSQELEKFAEELKHTGARILTVKADCSVKADVYAFCDAVREQFGTVDVLVNNAGTYLPGLLLDEADDRLEIQLNLNLNAAYYLSKYFGKMMRERASGHIFNICSIASKAVVENGGSYSVTKSALLSLNDVLREELSKHNVKVTAILPGSTLTSSWEGTKIPAERFVLPEDIASSLYTVLNLSKGVNVDEIVLKPVQF
ncbi:SDR family oxidoreductase [Pedobacter heparinus]|uniref:Short-chain dehydrogenase/reductase SDR n=1 Tax=Pedobacter heparinus (strain ATCC 13125 / DSM 2366 / CIP 104194 / JCM 7457 / NBRC 12017 / NCIMB 9290 / NRRL B-14731 / HIM 762-3) TaxID=485917 RepID=C6XSU0_PEDHD|nr:SDR family oxidoreductase [Pedobacter heparinus]ACU05653.1 short-chain dehydrogenase/reductase SDR [Pedobacter heparinus DSM 2366]